jgi:hypothetical protein
MDHIAPGVHGPAEEDDISDVQRTHLTFGERGRQPDLASRERKTY